MRRVERRGANHVLHLILSFLTCGLWAVTGWPIAAAMGRRTVTRTWEPERYSQAPPVDPYPGQMIWNPYSGRWVPRG